MPSRVGLVLILLAMGCTKEPSGTRKAGAEGSDDPASAYDGGASGDDGKADPAAQKPDGGAANGGGQTGPDGQVAVPSTPGKPPPYVDFDTMITAMRDDVKQIDNPIERNDVRYLVIAHLANAGASVQQLATYRSTMNLLVNSLSRGALLVAPKQLSAAPNVFRINLRDYRWNKAQWETIVSDYPYQIQYKDDSQVFPRDEFSAESLRAETGTNVPFVFLEWFTNKVSRAPLYYDLLNFPATLDALATQVDVDIAGDIREERAARAGVRSSVFTGQNRLLERHERIGNIGVFWLSYDFTQSSGKQDIFSHPLDFQHDGSEVIYALPNGLSAYMVVDAAGKRLDKNPITLGTDLLAPDRVSAPGLSCMGNCHYAHGFEKISDEVRFAVLAALPAGVDADTIRGLFPTQDKLDALIEGDRQSYERAAGAIGVDLSLEHAPYKTVERYQADVDLALAAALLGLRENDLRRALVAAPAQVPSQIRALADGKVITRRSFEELFIQTVCTLGIGEPLCAARDCGCATLEP